MYRTFTHHLQACIRAKTPEYTIRHLYDRQLSSVYLFCISRYRRSYTSTVELGLLMAGYLNTNHTQYPVVDEGRLLHNQPHKPRSLLSGEIYNRMQACSDMSDMDA